MAQQETFDAVVLALLKQNKPSVNQTGYTCMYRGKDGLKCAVGHLIPDELYHEGLEGKSANMRPVDNILRDLGHDIELCTCLQAIHDGLGPKYWALQFRSLAKDKGLSVKVIDEFEATKEATE